MLSLQVRQRRDAVARGLGVSAAGQHLSVPSPAAVNNLKSIRGASEVVSWVLEEPLGLEYHWWSLR